MPRLRARPCRVPLAGRGDLRAGGGEPRSSPRPYEGGLRPGPRSSSAGRWGLIAQFPAPLKGGAAPPAFRPLGARGTARPAPTGPQTTSQVTER
ncbi:hypothetical protein C6Y14_11620 [Streptomyces dioscori]|uniref:Uncharacterized protein n=1 Tax=Streptomyces dioscori TaxID=2109333 RepID=A0A2P8Q9B7_9ACTN|nr:hypothetical protein C6Y14_11620 [Streptomyces dioscori]